MVDLFFTYFWQNSITAIKSIHNFRFPGEPVDVGVTLYILSITPESDDATVSYGAFSQPLGLDSLFISLFEPSLFSPMQDFTYDFYFRQYWKDPRLAFIGDNIDAISLSDDFSSQIWLPDTFFPNEKDSKSHEETTANEMIRLSSDGSVMRSVRWESNISGTFYFAGHDDINISGILSNIISRGSLR